MGNTADLISFPGTDAQGGKLTWPHVFLFKHSQPLSTRSKDGDADGKKTPETHQGSYHIAGNHSFLLLVTLLEQGCKIQDTSFFLAKLILNI